MPYILGADPGISGALVLLDDNRLQYCDHLLMPTIKVGSKNRVNGAAISAWLSPYIISHAYLEKVHAMPGGGKRTMGASSAFTFGHCAGFLEGIITGAEIPLTLVPPTQWKKHAGLIGKDKDAARSRAVQLFPDLRVLDLKIKGQAVADALLIGRYGHLTNP
jgi:crossover junction endodeoxyribonuclease RuvC